MRNLFDLSGKVAIVTGSTKGLGRAMAEGLAHAGADVVVSSRKQDLCDQVAAEIRATTGREVLGLACHVGDWEAIPGFVDAVLARFGHVDVLVNNAGINPTHMSVADMTLEYWNKVLQVNLTGTLRMAQVVAASMRERGIPGSIINIASMGAYDAGAGNSAYGASKAAMVNLTRTMAAEWANDKIRVNVIAPGPIKSELTEGTERIAPGFYERAAAATLLKRVAETVEIVGPVVYLASDASSFVTADDLSVSGGMRG